ANQAASFDSISRSSRSTRFSRRSRLSSSRSAVVSPSLRRPSSSPACLTHLRIALAEASNSRANSAIGRPARTCSTNRRRYSGAYGGGVLGIVDLLFLSPQTPSTNAGQLHVIESPFATVRLRDRATRGAGSRTKGLLMAFKLLDMAQQRWRRLNGAHLLSLVRAGTKFIDGVQEDRAKNVTQSTENEPREAA